MSNQISTHNLYSHCLDPDLNGQKTRRYTHLRPYETRNLLFSGMIFHSSQVVFRIENLVKKYHLLPSSSVLGTIVGSRSVFIFIKYLGDALVENNLHDASNWLCH